MDRQVLLLGGLTVLLLLGQFASTWEVGFLSDDWAMLERTARYHSCRDAFLESPPRPMAFLHFYLLQQVADPSPLLARLPNLLAHLAVVALVFLLAMELGARRGAAIASALLFAAFDNAHNLVWVSAFGEPARAAFALASLLALIRLWKNPRSATGAIAVLCLALGLMAKQSAMIAPIAYVIWWLTVRKQLPSTTPTSRWALRAWLSFVALVAIAYLVYCVAIRPDRPGGIALAGLAAGVVKAATVPLPGVLQHPIIEGLRCAPGDPSFWLGASLLVAVVIALLTWMVKGGALARFAVLVAAADFSLPMLFSGFNPRHGYLGVAVLVAVLPMQAAMLRPTLRWGAVGALTLVGLLWIGDGIADVRTLKEASVITEKVLDEARTLELESRGREIVVVDLPLTHGWKRFPVFNWGFHAALARRGVGGRWIPVTTHPLDMSSEQRQVPEHQIARWKNSPDHVVAIYDPKLRSLVRN